jgi:AcrR family transcriptional regulator
VHIREDILRTAAQQFGELGYHRARLEDVARALGMKKGSLYYHIDSKEDLLFVLHDRLIDELTRNTVTALEQADGVEQQVRAAVRVAMRLIAEHQQEVTVFLHERHVFSWERWAGIRAKRDAYERLVAGVLEAGVSAGRLRSLPAPLATKGILGMVNWGYQWFHSDGRFTADEIAEVFADLVLNGLLPRTEPTRRSIRKSRSKEES